MLSYAPKESTEINAMFRDVIIDYAHSFQSMKHHSKSALQTCSMCSSGFTYYPAGKHTLACFSEAEVNTLSRVYLSLYESISPIPADSLPYTYKKMRSIALNNEEQFNGGQYVFAKTVFSFTESQSEEEVTTVFTDPLCRPSFIDHFAIHNFYVNGSSYTHCFAVASWPQKHPDIIFLGKPYIYTKFGVNHCLSDHYQIFGTNIKYLLCIVNS